MKDERVSKTMQARPPSRCVGTNQTASTKQIIVSTVKTTNPGCTPTDSALTPTLPGFSRQSGPGPQGWNSTPLSSFWRGWERYSAGAQASNINLLRDTRRAPPLLCYSPLLSRRLTPPLLPPSRPLRWCVSRLLLALVIGILLWMQMKDFSPDTMRARFTIALSTDFSEWWCTCILSAS